MRWPWALPFTQASGVVRFVHDFGLNDVLLVVPMPLS
jgi:hypothetical protein